MAYATITVAKKIPVQTPIVMIFFFTVLPITTYSFKEVRQPVRLLFHFVLHKSNWLTNFSLGFHACQKRCLAKGEQRNPKNSGDCHSQAKAIELPPMILLPHHTVYIVAQRQKVSQIHRQRVKDHHYGLDNIPSAKLLACFFMPFSPFLLVLSPSDGLIAVESVGSQTGVGSFCIFISSAWSAWALTSSGER